MINGSDHDAVVPPQIQEICDAVPHFGDAWPKTTFQNLQGNEIIMLTPPERLPLEKPKFFSKITLMTRQGPADVGFEIPQATTLAEAEHFWRGAAQAAIVEMDAQIRKNQRRVMLPGEVGPAAPFPKKIALNS